jgi:hypothetical protein
MEPEFHYHVRKSAVNSYPENYIQYTPPHYLSSEGFDDGVLHVRESCFWTLSIVLMFLKNTTFRKLDVLPSSDKVMATTVVD